MRMRMKMRVRVRAGVRIMMMRMSVSMGTKMKMMMGMNIKPYRSPSDVGEIYYGVQERYLGSWKSGVNLKLSPK